MSKYGKGPAQWCAPVNPALWRLGQEDGGFEAGLGCMERFYLNKGTENVGERHSRVKLLGDRTFPVPL